MSETLSLSSHQSLRIVASSSDRLELESTWRPGGDPPRTHWHPTQREQFEVLEGALTIEIEGQPARVFGPGDSIEVPPRTAHRMWNAGPEVTRASWIVTPAQRTEEMFRMVAHGLNPVSSIVLRWKYRGEMRLGRPRRT